MARARLMLDVVTAASGFPKRRGDEFLERGYVKHEGFLCGEVCTQSTRPF